MRPTYFRPALAQAPRARIPCALDVPTVALAAADAVSASGEQFISLEALGTDIFIFLIASVVVVPLSRVLDVTPVLGFLAVGCTIGPYGLGLLSNSEADVQLGDFGIVFLLFIEGLQLSPDRLLKLGGFFKLGLAQFIFTIAAITAANLYLGPLILPAAERFILLDDELVRPILSTPVLAFCLAGAGALSSSAFVLPELKQRGWEDRADGIAALAVLLLQDIAVAPLLVILPLVAGSGPQSPQELGILVSKATFGFGAVLAVGSVLLRELFNVVAKSKSSETFVAAALLVAIGMGTAADQLGLSTTTGAFAAGVLLAGSQYRQQIEADIKPFEGILLGIFFMTAGANLNPGLCIEEWPTLLSGIIAFLGAKLGLLFGLGAFAFGLTRAEAIRVALLLAGGGEFAFIVFKLAEDLGLLGERLGSLLTASVIISMSLTPLLGSLAEYVGDQVDRIDADTSANKKADELFDVIDADGDGFIEMEELRKYLGGGGTAAAVTEGGKNLTFEQLFAMLDENGDGVISREEMRQGYLELILGKQRDSAQRYAAEKSATPYDMASAELATARDAVVVCGYGEMGQRACDVLADMEGMGGGAGADELRDQVELPTAGAWGTQFIAFDRNPSRVAVGLSKQVRVVYGDGASPELLKAAGITVPRAIVVTYANDKRCLEATRRLREAFPDAPIYVRANTALEAEPLVEAGATEVVVEAVEAAVRFAQLLGGTAKAESFDSRLSLERRRRTLLLPEKKAYFRSDKKSGGQSPNDAKTPSYSRSKIGRAVSNEKLPPYPREQLEALALECGTTLTQICRLYAGFATLNMNDDGEVELDAIRDMLQRVSVTPIDDQALEAWMAEADEDGNSSLSFFEYVRVDAESRQRLSGKGV